MLAESSLQSFRGPLKPSAPSRERSAVRLGILLLSLLMAALSQACLGQQAVASAPGKTNVALASPYTLDPRPSYEHCTDPGDATQLTDGKLTEGHFWVQKGTVGWVHADMARITIDLGKVQPIAGLSFRTAAGTAGVGWPEQLLVFLSEDGKAYSAIGDLVDLSAEHGLPEAVGYRVHTYWTDRLQTKGRFVQIVMVLASSYGFCDEIEVWRGDEAWLTKPVGGREVGDVATYMHSPRAATCVRRCLRLDAAKVRKAIETANMPADKRDASLRKLDELIRQISSVTVADPNKLKAVVPINDLHSKILACNLDVLESRGLKGLVVWQNKRWDPLSIVYAPEPEQVGKVDLSLRMMRGEHRAVAFNITNVGAGWGFRVDMSELRAEGGPATAVVPKLTFHNVEYVDTKEGVVVADALPHLPRQGGIANCAQVPHGTTRQVWVTCSTPEVPAGSYVGDLALLRVGGLVGQASIPADGHMKIPVRVKVEDLTFPNQPTLSLGMWDYTDEPYAYGITKANQPQAIADMKAHFVDTPWAHPSVIGHPEKKHLDADGNLKPGTIDFTRFDRWLEDWKGARRYFVFLSVGKSLTGFEMGTPQFDKLVGQWFTAWAEHCKAKGLKPKQVGVLLVDEPANDEQDRQILAWAKPIKAATDFFCIWIDPTHRKLGTPDQVAMLEACDAICPNVSIFYELGEKAKTFYSNLCKDGRRELWFYWCSGPARQLDPYSYHRLQAWHCWVHGAKGMGFWAYGDTGYANSWCEYMSRGTSFCPAYIAPDSITTSKHWEAVREGVEDYEYLHMLKARVDELTKAGKTSSALAKAKELLEEGPKRVTRWGSISWFTPRNRALADDVRLEVLDALVALSRE